MKNLLRFLILALICIPAFADEEEFPIGTLIIPMDKETQDLANDGIFLAYGLIYELLSQDFTVHVAINKAKVDQSLEPDVNYYIAGDLTSVATDYVSVINGADYLPYPVDSLRAVYTLNYKADGVNEAWYNTPLMYKGGPFIINADDADLVKAFLADNPAYAPVVIHELTSAKSFEIGETYQDRPKKIALLDSVVGGDDYTTDVLECYLGLAGISNLYYDRLTSEDINNGQLVVGSYYILWMPHWDLLDQPDATVAAGVVEKINEFVDAGGNVLATCRAIDSMSAKEDFLIESYMAINKDEADLVPSETQYAHNNLPFSQIGNYPFNVNARDTQIFRPYKSGDATLANSHTNDVSSYVDHVNIIAFKCHDSVPANECGPNTLNDLKWSYYALAELDDDDNNGYVHYVAGHQYASCKPTVTPGLIYSMNVTLKECCTADKKNDCPNNVNFWSQSDACMRITLHYDGGDESVSLEICDGQFRDKIYTEVGEHFGMTVGNEFEIWAEDPNENNDRFGTNYGPGCNGNGGANGVSDLGAIYLRNLTENGNIIIKDITVEWSCDGFSGGVNGGGCGTSRAYELTHFDIRVLDKDNGNNNCGTSSCDQCTNVYPDKGVCSPDGEISFSPEAKRGSHLTFDAGIGSVDDTSVLEANVGGLRYIYNTLFNKVVNPITVAEFARSGPVARNFTFTDGDGNTTTKTFVFFGTFEYPGNAGHYRAFEATGDGGTLTEVWDVQDGGVPSYLERKLFTIIDGTKVDFTPDNAETIYKYLQDADYTVDSIAENINSLLGKYRQKRMGGVERSTSALITESSKISVSRDPVAIFGTTYGVLEIIDLKTGSEIGGYVPAAVLPNLEFTSTADVNRPKVDSSPTVLDAYLLKDGSTTEREWKTVVIVANGKSAGGISVLDFSDPTDVQPMWTKTDTIVPDPDDPPDVVESYGNTQRVTVASYKKLVKDDQTGTSEYTFGYAAIVASNLPAENENGMAVAAYDLKTGDLIDWPANPIKFTYSAPVSGINDIPPPVAIADTDENGYDDFLFIGDMQGRLWKIAIDTGVATQLHETLSGALPNLPTQEARPIGATPTYGNFKGTTVVAFGTGGTNWSNATNNYVKLVDFETGADVLTVDIGTKRIFSPIIVAGNQIFFTAVEGTLGSADPTIDIQSDDEVSELYNISVETVNGQDTVVTRKKTLSKSESSMFVKNGQTYSGSFDGSLTRSGDKVDQSSADGVGPTSFFDYQRWFDITNTPVERKVIEPPKEPDGPDAPSAKSGE